MECSLWWEGRRRMFVDFGLYIANKNIHCIHNFCYHMQLTTTTNYGVKSPALTRLGQQTNNPFSSLLSFCLLWWLTCTFYCVILSWEKTKINPNLLDFGHELALQLIDNNADENAENVEAAMNIHNTPSFATVPHNVHCFNSQVWLLGSTQ